MVLKRKKCALPKAAPIEEPQAEDTVLHSHEGYVAIDTFADDKVPVVVHLVTSERKKLPPAAGRMWHLVFCDEGYGCVMDAAAMLSSLSNGAFKGDYDWDTCGAYQWTQPDLL